jgi:predicted RNase H-like HicB family nuclease
MSLKYAVIFERSENNWAAYVPDLPGCITTGRTPDETERNIQEAIRGHIRALREFGEPLPDPVSLAREIDVPPAAQYRNCTQASFSSMAAGKTLSGAARSTSSIGLVRMISARVAHTRG